MRRYAAFPDLPALFTVAAAGAAVAVACPTLTATGLGSRTDLGPVPDRVAAAQLRHSLPASATGAWASDALRSLRVAAPGSMAGYSRDLYPHWRDASTWGWPVAPNNSCGARNAALYRDGRNVTMSPTCTYLRGTWVDPYGGHRFDETGNIDIDHLVPLAENWRSGGAKWDVTARTRFANDPLVLMSSDDTLNQSKGDKDPADWKPPVRASWCNYAIRWVAIKAKYALTVDPAEKTALTIMLGTCR